MRAAVCTHFENGGKGAVELAEAVVEAAEEPGEFRMLYADEAPLRQKIEAIATEVYGADGVDYLPAAARQLDTYERAGFGTLPVCIAKTHLSISSDPTLLGCPPGLAPARARGAGQRGCRLRLPGQRRHAHHARALPQPGRRADRHRRARQRGRPLLTGTGEAHMAIDFTLAPEHEEIRSRVRSFIRDTVQPRSRGSTTRRG